MADASAVEHGAQGQAVGQTYILREGLTGETAAEKRRVMFDWLKGATEDEGSLLSPSFLL